MTRSIKVTVSIAVHDVCQHTVAVSLVTVMPPPPADTGTSITLLGCVLSHLSCMLLQEEDLSMH